MHYLIINNNRVRVDSGHPSEILVHGDVLLGIYDTWEQAWDVYRNMGGRTVEKVLSTRNVVIFDMQEW